MRKILALTACVALLLTTACSGGRAPLPGESVAVAAGLPQKGAILREESPLSRADLAFGLDLYKEMRAGGKGNLLLSPLSVASALSMTANGASGETRDQMERVLRIDGLGRDRANEEYAKLLRTLQEPSAEGSLTVSNALWADNGLPLEKAFVGRDRDFFGAQLTSMPFTDTRAVADAVNAWVSRQTRGKIPKLIEDIPDDTVMELVNALYFKGAWEDEFDPAKPKAFTLEDGSTPDVPTMTRAGVMRYLETPEFQAVALPYKDGREMLVFLPSKALGLAGFEKMLTAEDWESWTQRMQRAEGTLHLPRFTLKTKADLLEPLKAVGMTDALDPDKAEFKDMSSEPGLYIGQVGHSVYVAVDEKGTEAAAATNVGMDLASAAPVAPAKPFVMDVDRPFFFAIRDVRTTEVLFIGSVTDPRAE
jgi:serpin B